MNISSVVVQTVPKFLDKVVESLKNSDACTQQLLFPITIELQTTQSVILKEIFSNTGVGTMIHSNAYEKIRPMRVEDITDVLKIMKPYIADGILVNRTEEKFKETLEDFVVYEIDKTRHFFILYTIGINKHRYNR